MSLHKTAVSVAVRCSRVIALRACTIQQQYRLTSNETKNLRHPSPRRVKPVDEDFADAIEEDEVAMSAAHNPLVQRDPLKDMPSDTAFTEYLEEEAEGDNAVSGGDGMERVTERVLQRQALMRELPLVEFLERVMNYLRSTNNEKLVDAEEEDILFPVILERFKQFTPDQLLEIVSCLQARSTLARYGIKINDLVRDRISLLAATAAKQRREAQNAPSDGSESQKEDDSLFVDEAEAKKRLEEEDPILNTAAEQMTPETVLRSLLVMGMSARRKRDLAFFHTIGAYFAFYINHYKDPHDLVRVLTAFARAKILPPKAFLSMLSRRFPVLCKNNSLDTLPCYRAMVNFAKMGHEQMNIYRFLSDNMMSTIESNITERKRQIRLAQLRKEDEVNSSHTAVDHSEKDKLGDKSLNHQSEVVAEKEAEGKFSPSEILVSAIESIRIKTRFHDLVGVKPSMFTKWLFILAKNGAPYQQYLRPLVQPVIVPMLGHFPPPSFTRLLTAISYFKCDDIELTEPILDYMCKSGALRSEVDAENEVSEESQRPYCPIRADLFVLLNLFSREGMVLPKNMREFLHFCGDVFLESSLADPLSASQRSEKKKLVFKGEEEQFVLRPGDMCSIARHLVQLQRRVDIPLEDLAPFQKLMGHFTRRLHALLQLGVVSVLQVDDFADLCRQQLYADEDGSLEKLMALRRELAPFVDEDGMVEEEDGGPALDIDVRETFFKVVLMNDAYRYIAYRPLPGSLQVDFREALTKISSLDMLEAVDLYERCFPTALKPPVRLLLSRSFLAKFSKGGEEVMSEDGSELVLRQPPEQFVTRSDLEHFVDLIRRTPMSGVRESEDVKKFIIVKAARLGLNELLKDLQQKPKGSQEHGVA